MSELPPVVDNDAEHRFEVDVNGHLGFLTYRRPGQRLVLIHTEVPDELGGRGVGSALVRAAIDHAVAQHLQVVPLCPFAKSWLREHPDVAARVEIDWRDD